MKLPERFEFTYKPMDNEEDLELYRVVIDGNASIVSWGRGIYEGSTAYPTSSVERFVNEGTWVIQEEEMKLPESFKFVHQDYSHPIYTGEFTTTERGFRVSWESSDGGISDATGFSAEEAISFVERGIWIIQPESFDKTDTFNFIEKSMLVENSIQDNRMASQYPIVDIPAESISNGPIHTDVTQTPGVRLPMFKMTQVGDITNMEFYKESEPERTSIQEFCKETKAVVTIFPEYFQVAIRGAVTRLSTVEQLLELIDAVRVLNKYKLA